MKFTVGDKICIVAVSKHPEDDNEYNSEIAEKHIGQFGEVVDIDESYMYPYDIAFENYDFAENVYDFFQESDLMLQEDVDRMVGSHERD